MFENTDTMRFQVQEMARAERMLTDDAIADEVETYNELIPESGRAVGHAVHRAHRRRRAARVAPEAASTSSSRVRFELGRDGASRVAGRARSDEERLTRDDITSTVHYLQFPFDAAAARRVRRRARRGSWSTTPSTRSWVELTDAQRAELAGDFAD